MSFLHFSILPFNGEQEIDEFLSEIFHCMISRAMIYYFSLSEHSHEKLSNWYLLPLSCPKIDLLGKKTDLFSALNLSWIWLIFESFWMASASLTVWDLGLHWLQREVSLLLFLFFLWWIPVKLWRLFFSSEVSTAVPFLQMPTYDSTRVVKHCWSFGFQKRNLWHNLSFQYTNPHAEDPYLRLAN